MSHRNTIIALILAFSKNTWFWLGIWIFYYLRFTNYAGIGLIETVMIATITLSEIPTGAVADLLGKKKTLIIALVLEILGGILMATATGFNSIIIAVFTMCVGGAFYSGTIDALVFDSLKEDGKENEFGKTISQINTVSLLTPAACGLIGGFLYIIGPTLPFWGNVLGNSVGLVAALFLIEPHLDSEKFSFNNFLKQTTKGLNQLFQNSQIKKQTLLFLSIGFFVVISSEMLDDFLAVEFGFKPIQLGILWSGMYLISALGSHLTPQISQKLKGNLPILLVGISLSLTFLLSPLSGLIFGGTLLLCRASLQGVFNNLSSVAINNNVDSKFRATTLSTFNMIKNLPYVLTAFLIGSFADKFSARTIAFALGALLVVFLLLQTRSFKSSKSQQ